MPKLLAQLHSTKLRGRSSLELIWQQDGKGMGSYRIDILKAAEVTTRVRAALDRLQLDIYKGEAAKSAALRALARVGVELYACLMSGVDGDEEQGAEFKRWFESTVSADAPAWQVEICMDRVVRPIIPWGLVFTPGPDIAKLGADFESYANFWCINHRLAVYPSPDAPSMVGPLDELEGPHLSVVLEADDEDFAEHDPTRSYLRVNIEELEREVRSRPEHNHVLYINLRADGGELRFAGSDTRLTQHTAALLGRLIAATKKGALIAFVDREAIIRGDREGGPAGENWINVFFDSGWLGFLAVETDIVDDRLRYEGFKFLSAILEPIPDTREVPALARRIVGLRKQFWPQSLFYGIYCNPNHALVSPQPDWQPNYMVPVVMSLNKRSGAAS